MSRLNLGRDQFTIADDLKPGEAVDAEKWEGGGFLLWFITSVDAIVRHYS